MKKYKCPYCQENTFSFWKKFAAGGMASKGTECPKCGKHAIHGLQSTIFRTVLMCAVLCFMFFNYCNNYVPDWVCVIVFAAACLIGKTANGLLFELEINNRRDIK